MIFISSRFAGRTNKPNADAYLEDDPVAGQPCELTLGPAAREGGVHGGAEQEVLHRDPP